jgi:hypothetical protein
MHRIFQLVSGARVLNFSTYKEAHKHEQPPTNIAHTRVPQTGPGPVSRGKKNGRQTDQTGG